MMPPNSGKPSESCTGILGEDELETVLKPTTMEHKLGKSSDRKTVIIVWKNVILFSYLHLAAIYGLYLIFTSAKIATTIFAIFLYQFGMFGVTGGAHRLWSHRSYKAKWPLKVILLIANSIAFQNSAFDWARDHRLHHKYSETDADPHNSKRGFFFAHIGWLLCRKHELVKEKGKSIDLSDLKRDPWLMFQKRYYTILIPLLCFVMPTFVPYYLWNESLMNAWHVATLWRYAMTLNSTWFVNSLAHWVGIRPYDRHICPVENRWVSYFALGEGWHNYHHVFPWDYRAAELGEKYNLSTSLIDLFARIGWAYDMKMVADESVRKRVLRTGDGTHSLWGWGDENQTQENIRHATILHPNDEKTV